MKVEGHELLSRMDRFKDACKRAGIRLTHQRLEIFQAVARAGDHPGVDQVYRTVRRRIPTISLDTVYRTLWLLVDLGAITTMGPPKGRVRFDANMSRHHHFVCNRCGMARDFYSDAFDGLEVPEAVLQMGRVETTRVELRGLCSRCSELEGTRQSDRRTAK